MIETVSSEFYTYLFMVITKQPTMKTKLILGISLAFLACTSFAQDDQPEATMAPIFSLSSDQDFLVIPGTFNKDQNYTMGLALQYTNFALYDNISHAPQRLVYSLFENLDIVFDPFTSSIGLLATGFTPEDLAAQGPVIGDRPYAILFALSTSSVATYIHESERVGYLTSTINYGLMGTYVGREVQSEIHSWPGQTRPIPQGWETQIGDGGYPTMLFDLNYFLPFAKNTATGNQFQLSSDLGVDGGINYGGSVGYYDRLYGGLHLRAGLIDKNDVFNWFGTFSALSTGSYMLSPDEATAESKPNRQSRWEAFVFGQATGTFMIDNSFLTGFNKDNSYALAYDDMNLGVAELAAGIGVSYKWLSQKREIKTLSLQFKDVFRSPEFNSGIFPPRWHSFGSIAIILGI